MYEQKRRKGSQRGFAIQWEANHPSDERLSIGSVLESLLGYDGSPSLIEVLGYMGYYLLIWVVTRLT
jgi:hypothetical protein